MDFKNKAEGNPQRFLYDILLSSKLMLKLLGIKACEVNRTIQALSGFCTSVVISSARVPLDQPVALQDGGSGEGSFCLPACTPADTQEGRVDLLVLFPVHDSIIVILEK